MKGMNLPLLELIHNRRDGKDYSGSVEFLDLSSLQKVVEFQNQIMQTIQDPDILATLSAQEFSNILEGGGVAAGVWVKGGLVAFLSAWFPEDRKENLGYDVDLPTSELSKVVHFESSFVHPDFQGNNLQVNLCEIVLEKVKSYQRYRYLLGTVSPRNYYCLKTVFTIQAVIVRLMWKYLGRQRFIFFRDLVSPLALERNSEMAILITDLEKQADLLREGYCGFRFEKGERTSRIVYARPKK